MIMRRIFLKQNKMSHSAIFHVVPSFFQEPWLKKFVFYNSPVSESLKNFVKSAMFGYVVAFVLLLNLVAVITETTV